MMKATSDSIRKINLADQYFANEIIGKYGWGIDNRFVRGKLDHRVHTHQRSEVAYAQPSVIQVTKIFQPLHLKLIYEYHQLNQIIQHRNGSLIATPPLSNIASVADESVVTNSVTRQVSTLFEKVKQVEQRNVERIISNRIQQQGVLIRMSLTDMHRTKDRQAIAFTNEIRRDTLQVEKPIDASISSTVYSTNDSITKLTHIEPPKNIHREKETKAAVAKMIFSPLIREITEYERERERITTSIHERQVYIRTKAILNGISNRNQFHHVEQQSLMNTINHYFRTTTEHVRTIKDQKSRMSVEHKLVYIPRTKENETTITKKATLVFRNLHTQVDLQLGEDQHLYKQQNDRQEIIKAMNSEKSTLLQRQQAILANRTDIKQQQRRLIATALQIRTVTNWHQQLIERHERLVYQIEMIEKKKTPRSRKLTLLPVVKLTYRALPVEQITKHTVLRDDVSIVQHEKQRAESAVSKQNVIRRQAQLIYTNNRVHHTQHMNSTQHVNNTQHGHQMATSMKKIVQQVTEQPREKITKDTKNTITIETINSVANNVTHKVVNSITNEVVKEIRKQPMAWVVSKQLIHMTKVNKGQLQQVKLLQNRLKQLQTIPVIMTHRHDEYTQSSVGNIKSSDVKSTVVNQKRDSITLHHNVQYTISTSEFNNKISQRLNTVHVPHRSKEFHTMILNHISTKLLGHNGNSMLGIDYPKSSAQLKTIHEKSSQLVVSNQLHKTTNTRNVIEQATLNNRQPTNLHVAKQASTRQENKGQRDAVKQLEETVKRLEQELTVTKEAQVQPNVIAKQLSDQLFSQLVKKIRLEQRRTGR